MKLEEIKALMAKEGRAIIKIKNFKNHDMVNFWARFPNAEDPVGLRCELTLNCHIEDLSEQTVRDCLVGSTKNGEERMK